MADHMTPDEFRLHGKRVVDWIADYWESVSEFPIVPSVAPGDIRAALPTRAPEAGEPFEDILADLDRIVMPGVTHWQSPGWFAYFPANVSFPAILGEMAAAGLGQQGMLWQTSPATTELESQMLDWLVELMGMPQAWKSSGPGGGVLQMSASDSTHTAIVVARTRHPGVDPSRMVAYASEQAHSSVEKGSKVAGIGHVRLIGTDQALALRPEELAAAMDEDVASGLVPVFACATVGTTGTTAIDPVRSIAEIARDRGAWVHVDAAYAGSAMICEEFRHHVDGVDLVDSYTFNPHKWLLTNFDCSVFWVADRRPLIDTMSIVPPYLRNPASDSGQVIDYRDWHVPLGRRFRALKLWFVLRHYGAEGLRTHIRRHVDMARRLATRIDEHPRLETVAPTPFSLVSFAHRHGNEATDRIVTAINGTGTSYVVPSVLGDRRFVRVAVGSTLTEQHHVDAVWETIEASA
ncbi:MAG TPA: pyridoxal-dependent decarboxylase [Acidimicrobiia bacterium]|nr:pyridoxal-dependent decarboxylase [Acidimicrobiia bacterium]